MLFQVLLMGALCNVVDEAPLASDLESSLKQLACRQACLAHDCQMWKRLLVRRMNILETSPRPGHPKAAAVLRDSIDFEEEVAALPYMTELAEALRNARPDSTQDLEYALILGAEALVRLPKLLPRLEQDLEKLK